MSDTQTLANKPLKDIVGTDFRAAGVFEKYGLDFCCQGATALGAACEAKGLDTEALARELAQALATPDPSQPRYAEWDADVLITHILTTHHVYVRNAIPTIITHVDKVGTVHGANHPEAVTVCDIFHQLANELWNHMGKEENVLFPHIKALAVAKREGTAAPAPHFGTVRNPISMMLTEHDAAGEGCKRIRELTNNYTAPDDACTTYRVLYQELAAFEADLHQHVYLENSILFPKAVELEG
jgi:regulator of cell morphogenesis and NO signaling